MADNTYAILSGYADANITTNNANLITGAKMNVMLNSIIEGLAGKLFDTTKPYKEGQSVLYEDGTWGFEIWMADSDLVAGAWNSANFTRLSKRSEEITASDTPYTGIEKGTKTYSHNIGHVKFMIQAFDSSGAMIPLDVQSKSTTKITIYSALNYSNAVVYISEIVIS